ncbi:acyl carrier protein [Streptomyces sp. NPDC005409]|uniref:acyl carrier protein n=1 Tax=Streptomyces sp. NPDC005409 TaxID=3155342 RepID=UPI0034556695
MKVKEFTLDDLVRILRECADQDVWTEIELGADIADEEFESLGYDSLSLFNTLTRIENECGVELSYDIVYTAATPGTLVKVVNEALLSKA